MREIILNKTGSLKCYNLPSGLFASDFESSIKSFTPGEWAVFTNKKKGESFLGFINPLVEGGSPCAYALTKDVNLEPLHLLETQLIKSWEKRKRITDYNENARMIYGTSDGLPGLIVDAFKNCVVVQINCAGLDKYREELKESIEKLSKKPVMLLDNQSYRMAEGLPSFPSSSAVDRLEIQEGELLFNLDAKQMQKVGFYYDHRENRRKLKGYLERLDWKPEKALDLFSYLGAWGMTMSLAGVKSVELVDQADFTKLISENWEANKLEGEFKFHHEDVFNFLKQKSNEGEKYELIVSDPPAFCKSPKGAKKALQGYLKLHRACLKLLEDKSLFAVCSCTRYVDIDSLAQNASLAARQEGKRLTLLDIGTQGFDHPSSNFKDNANYLKYLLFYVENL
ncbi:MAG: hypothetical protein CME64_15265 [Halobacteriovoraceae bacterium]|nr:hypothetical protein [Halobacteriovoraceae bacterium]